jgi:hypothetical protein
MPRAGASRERDFGRLASDQLREIGSQPMWHVEEQTVGDAIRGLACLKGARTATRGSGEPAAVFKYVASSISNHSFDQSAGA